MEVWREIISHLPPGSLHPILLTSWRLFYATVGPLYRSVTFGDQHAFSLLHGLQKAKVSSALARKSIRSLTYRSMGTPRSLPCMPILAEILPFLINLEHLSLDVPGTVAEYLMKQLERHSVIAQTQNIFGLVHRTLQGQHVAAPRLDTTLSRLSSLTVKGLPRLVGIARGRPLKHLVINDAVSWPLLVDLMNAYVAGGGSTTLLSLSLIFDQSMKNADVVYAIYAIGSAFPKLLRLALQIQGINAMVRFLFTHRTLSFLMR